MFRLLVLNGFICFLLHVVALGVVAPGEGCLWYRLRPGGQAINFVFPIRIILRVSQGPVEPLGREERHHRSRVRPVSCGKLGEKHGSFGNSMDYTEKSNKSSKHNSRVPSVLYMLLSGSSIVSAPLASCRPLSTRRPGNHHYTKNPGDETANSQRASRANKLERDSTHIEVSERSTPPIVRRGKTKNRKAKGKRAPVPPKTRPPKGRSNIR